MKTLLDVIYIALNIYSWLIVARALLSWFPMQSGTVMYKIYMAVYSATEPYLAVFRRFLPTPRIGSVGIDLSAVVGLLVIIVLMQILARVPVY
jgi:YggT family protein